MNEIDLFIGCTYHAVVDLVGSREAKVSPCGPGRTIKLSRRHFEVLNDDVLKLIKGIPITTEIIEKLGGVFFDYEPLPDSDRHRLYYKFKLSDESYLMLATNQVGEIKIYIHEGHTDAEIFLREIEFVHELQNAFHGISGKELEFKL